MRKRHTKLGIKQTIQKHWMDYTIQLMLSGLSEFEIRSELDSFLSSQKQSGGVGERGKKTYGMAISILASWFSPENDLVIFRDQALKLLKKASPEMWLPYHFAIISASYPFWFNVAKQTGKLLNLQEHVTQKQVFSRLKEQYGDRETVARNARYTIRSFIAWGILCETDIKGCYTKNTKIIVNDIDSTILLFTAALHANSEGKGTIDFIINNPAFFAFSLPVITSDYIAQESSCIEVIHSGFNEELLKLKYL